MKLWTTLSSFSQLACTEQKFSGLDQGEVESWALIISGLFAGILIGLIYVLDMLARCHSHFIGAVFEALTVLMLSSSLSIPKSGMVEPAF